MPITGPPPTPTPRPVPPDRISLERLAKLHPAISAEALAIATSLWQAGVWLRVTHTFRTWEEQAALYAKGRSMPGRVVTNAKPGQSYHNYGLALDFTVLTPQGKVSWDRDADFNADALSDWFQVVEAFKAKGWEWGGDWKSFKDYPHLQKTFNHPVRNLLARSSHGIIKYPALT